MAKTEQVHIEQNKFGMWRVYKWGQRPDHEVRTADDKECWLLDSEHETEQAALKRKESLTKK
jgi:hypothetical protein